MTRAAHRWAAVMLAVCAAAGVTASRASASIAWHTCRTAKSLACARLTVPLDPGGTVPGTISLALRRRRAPVGNDSVAVIALAGGPGQAALPFAPTAIAELGPAVLSTRDLIVFDQRGTGASGALHCKAISGAGFASNPPASRVALCARQLGKRRLFYTTAQSVADIEAIRVAGGYKKLVLFGTSYGTKVALDYARAYPDRVSRLVLDSTVAPNGPSTFSRASFKEIPRALKDLCSGGACAHITAHPIADLTALVKRLQHRPIHGTVYNSHGVGKRVNVSEDDILDILVNGDLDPTLRSDFPAAVSAALKGDPAQLARLRQRALGGSSEGGIDNPLFYSTICEEAPYPWKRSAAPKTRLREAIAAARKLNPASFAPFSLRALINFSAIPNCYAWPYQTAMPAAAPAVTGASLPDIPMLFISGQDDMRTPTADARSVAATVPDAKLVVVPHTGHSVLGSDLGSCSSDAMRAFFQGHAIRSCKGDDEQLPQILRPAPLAPDELSAVAPSPGLSTRTGRVVTAFELTVSDVQRQIQLRLDDAQLSGGPSERVDVGGLRGGWARLAGRVASIYHVSYVPGVSVSGNFGHTGDVLRIAGPAGLQGVLRQSPNRGAFVGYVGGVAVDVPASKLMAD